MQPLGPPVATGREFPDFQSIAIAPNQGPTAAFTFSLAGATAVDFDASGSSDPDGTVVRYAWDFGDGCKAPDGGRTRFLQTIKVPFTVAETGEPAVLGVCMDITERKRADARFRRLIDSNVQGVYFWNTNGKIAGANDAFLSMVGYTREDLDAGRLSWAEMTPPEWVEQSDDRSSGAREMDTFFLEGPVTGSDYRLLGDGRRRRGNPEASVRA